jgi:hypothetical protein
LDPELNAAQLLARIAAILIRLGFDEPKAQRLLRHAYVIAASEVAQDSAERPTQSRIATIAGISRLEVRTLLAQEKSRSRVRRKRHPTRFERVTNGWRTDPLFLDEYGRPKELTLKGVKGSFGHLVRKYGHDVTAKSLRDELVRQGFASIQDRRISLLHMRNHGLKKSDSAEADLRSLISQLGDIDFRSGKRAYVVRRSSIDNLDKKTALMLRRVAVRRIETVLKSIGETSSEKREKRKTSPKKSQSRRLHITAVVAMESEEKVQ